MEKPNYRYFDNHRKTSWLYFDKDESRECYMRGGICFPVKYQSLTGIDNHGYAIIAGQDLKTGRVHVFEQMNWITTDDILAKMYDGKMPINAIKYPGLSHWLNMAWNKYFLQTFYFSQPDELSRRFRIQIIRSLMINPKPRFVDVSINNKDDLLSAIWHRIKTGQLEIEKDSEIGNILKETMVEDRELFPQIHALGCCLLGFEQYPWRKPYEQPI
ncbi:MAG: hypothetical protein KAT54_09245, partial [Candidatus Marinimicrobia bacterium]|nr:hypothetical protein [Candidatus Neomarinimicrobiota bacterium]